MDELLQLLAIVISAIVCLAVYLLPTIISILRGHHYKWVILGINLIFGLTGVGYLVAFIWAVWPRMTAVLDVVTNDPTTNSPDAGKKIYGQMNSNIRALQGRPDSTPEKISPNNREAVDYEETLRRLAKLRDEGIITEEEFTKMKSDLLGL